MSPFQSRPARRCGDQQFLRCVLAATLWASGCIDSPDPEFTDLDHRAPSVQAPEPDDHVATATELTDAESSVRVVQYESTFDDVSPSPVSSSSETPAAQRTFAPPTKEDPEGEPAAEPAPFPSDMTEHSESLPESESATRHGRFSATSPPTEQSEPALLPSDSIGVTISSDVPPALMPTGEMEPLGVARSAEQRAGTLPPAPSPEVPDADEPVTSPPSSSQPTSAEDPEAEAGPLEEPTPVPLGSESLPQEADALSTSSPLTNPLSNPAPSSDAKPLDERKASRPLIHISPKSEPTPEPTPDTTATTETKSAPPFPSEPTTENKTTPGIPVRAVAIASPPESLKPSEPEENSATATTPQGFIALFNTDDLTGWEVHDGKQASWQMQEGVISCIAPGGGWLQSQSTFSDFELQFEYRLSEGGNSGVALRYPGVGNPSLVGLEIQLLDDQAEKYQNIRPEQSTGSLYFVRAPKIRDAAKPAGEWNLCALRCIGNKLQVTINGQLVNDIDMSHLSTLVEGVAKPITSVRSPMGSIAFQSHPTRIDLRHVYLHDMTQAFESGVRWLDLQDGIGEPVPEDAKVTVHYIGHLSSGKRFANSLEKGKPTTVLLKDVIPGWREGIPGMKVGGKRRLIVPATMAYGVKGFKEVIPPNSTLVYEIELIGYDRADTH